jgi:hypothetical protein
MQAAKRSITSRVTIKNPRPRKYASAAEKQAAFRARFPTICVRVEPKTAETVQAIADASGRTQQETLLSMLKYAMTNRNWLTLGLTEHKQLPRKENPMKRKPSPAQIAARERFAAMARSGAFKKKAKRNPAKKTVSQKISQLTREGYPQKQAVAIALSEERAGKVKRNPISDIANIIYNQLGANRFAMMTGAKNFVAGDDFLMFSIGKNQSVYNKVRITLTPDDLYDVEFFKMNRLGDIAKQKKYEGMYAEQLPTLFTDVTGLYTSLGTMGRRSNPRASNPIILVSDKAIATKRKANPMKRKVMKEQRPFYYVVKVGQSYDGQFSSAHYSLEDVKKIAQQKADKYGAQAKITELH